VKGFRELLGVVVAGLTARKIRTALIVLGPLIGVGAIVAAVGLTESQTGALKARLKELGTTLIEAEAGGGFGAEQDPRFPEDVYDRVLALRTVDSVAGVTSIAGIQVLPHDGAEDEFRAVPVPVLAADPLLLDVIEVEMKSGRWINEFDVDAEVRVAVIGQQLAQRYAFVRGENRTISLNDIDYAVLGVLGNFAFDPGTFDSAVFIPTPAAEEDFDSDPEPAKLYVRAVDGETERTANALARTISLGGPDETATSIPSDLLESEAETDKALRNIVILMGGLALFVGGVGIANVMSISVIQRSGLLGVVAGAGVVYAVSEWKDWLPILDWPNPFIWVLPAIGISILFGLYPSVRAARLEPLETLRLG